VSVSVILQIRRPVLIQGSSVDIAELKGKYPLVAAISKNRRISGKELALE
jgi:hypothetical protein